MHSSSAMDALLLVRDDIPKFYIWAAAVTLLVLVVVASVGSNFVCLPFAIASATPLFLLLLYILSFASNFRLETWTAVFTVTFVLRCTGVLWHMISSLIRKPRKIASKVYSPSDVTVVLPTVRPDNPGFRKCVSTILMNKPHSILVVTVGSKLRRQCLEIIGTLIPSDNNTTVKVGSVDKGSKRQQISHALRQVETSATVLVRDDCSWASGKFLSSLLAEIDGERVSVVMTRQHASRSAHDQFWSFVSVSSRIAGGYLEYWNWVLRVVNAVDGGVALIPGSTCVFETKFLKDHLRLNRFCSERFFFGLLRGEGLDADGESFLIREALTAGLGVKYRDTGEALVEISFGQDWSSFFMQVRRWERSASRRSAVYLIIAKFFSSYPLAYFMIHLAGLVDFTLFWDGILLYSQRKSEFLSNNQVAAFMVWLIVTKDITIITHIGKHSLDVCWLLFHILIGYGFSIVKLILLTFYNCTWSGLEAITPGDDTPGGYHFSVVQAPGVAAAADEVAGRAIGDSGELEEQTVERSKEEAVEKAVEVIVAQLVEQAVEETVQHLQQVAFEQPGEDFVQQPVEDAVDQQTENVVEKQTEDTVEQPTEEMIDQLEPGKPATKRKRRKKTNKTTKKKKGTES